MPSKWVLVPFNGSDDKASVSAYRAAWEDRQVSGIATNTKAAVQVLGRVEAGDTIYVQAHGYTNDFDIIGGLRGKAALDATGIATLLLTLLPHRPARLKVKVFSCFSGFGFAREVFVQLKNQLPEVAVYGYKGETQVTARGTRKGVLKVPDKLGRPGHELAAYVEHMGDHGHERRDATVAASLADVRMVYTAAHPNGRSMGLHGNPWA